MTVAFIVTPNLPTRRFFGKHVIVLAASQHVHSLKLHSTDNGAPRGAHQYL
jgi:hypothetical protein